MLRLLPMLFVACAKPLPPEPPAVQSDVKITMTFGTEETREIVIAPDGTYRTTITREGKPTTTWTGRVTGDELVDAAGNPIARIGDDDALSFLDVTEERRNGELFRKERSWPVLGTFEADGTFIAKQDGERIRVGADGRVSGFPFRGLNVTVKARTAAQKRAAILYVFGTLSSGTTVIDNAGPYHVYPPPVMTN